MYTTIDNPGSGNCGYYAMAIGLIHLIQEEHKNHQTQTLYERWSLNTPRRLEPIDEFLSHDLNHSLTAPLTYNQPFLYAVQRNLRCLFVNHYQKDFFDKLLALKTFPLVPTHLQDSKLYMDFAELIYVLVDNDEQLEDLPLTSSLEFTDELIALAKGAAVKIKGIEANLNQQEKSKREFEIISQILIDEVLTQENTQNSNSIVINAASYQQSNLAWANDYNLSHIAEILTVQLCLNGFYTGTINPTKTTIRLNNLENKHWNTQIETQTLSIPLESLSLAPTLESIPLLDTTPMLKPFDESFDTLPVIEDTIPSLMKRFSDEILSGNYINISPWKKTLANRKALYSNSIGEQIEQSVLNALTQNSHYFQENINVYIGCLKLPDMQINTPYHGSSEYYFNQAKALGSSMALVQLANINQDKKQAFELNKMAADLSDPIGICNLASHYYEGEGVTKNKKKGYALLDKAIEEGNVYAMSDRAGTYLSKNSERDEKIALELLKKTIELGSLESYAMLGGILSGYESMNTERVTNAPLGDKLLKKAADLGNYYANFVLCSLAQDLEVCEQDDVQFMFYYERINRYSLYENELIDKAKKVAKEITPQEANAFLEKIWTHLLEGKSFSAQAIDILKEHSQQEILEKLFNIDGSTQEKITLLNHIRLGKHPLSQIISNNPSIKKALEKQLQQLSNLLLYSNLPLEDLAMTDDDIFSALSPPPEALSAIPQEKQVISMSLDIKPMTQREIMSGLVAEILSGNYINILTWKSLLTHREKLYSKAQCAEIESIVIAPVLAQSNHESQYMALYLGYLSLPELTINYSFTKTSQAYFQQAEEAGNSMALVRRAYVTEDPKTRFELNTAAEKLNNPLALCNLANAYKSGCGVEQDLDQCKTLLEKGIQQKNAYAMLDLAMFLLEAPQKKDHEKRAFSLLNDAANLGNIEAHTQLGKMLSVQSMTHRIESMAEVERLLKSAAGLGAYQAHLALCKLYSNQDSESFNPVAFMHYHERVQRYPEYNNELFLIAERITQAYTENQAGLFLKKIWTHLIEGKRFSSSAIELFTRLCQEEILDKLLNIDGSPQEKLTLLNHINSAPHPIFQIIKNNPAVQEALSQHLALLTKDCDTDLLPNHTTRNIFIIESTVPTEKIIHQLRQISSNTKIMLSPKISTLTLEALISKIPPPNRTIIVHPNTSQDNLTHLFTLAERHHKTLLLPAYIPLSEPSNFEAIINLWIEKGEDLDALQENGWTALKIAVFNNEVQAAKRLLQQDQTIKGLSLPLENHSEVPLFDYVLERALPNMLSLFLNAYPELQVSHQHRCIELMKTTLQNNDSEMFSILSKFFPLKVSLLLENQATPSPNTALIKTLLIDFELTEEQVALIPSHIKTLSYDKSLSTACLTRLRAAGFDLNYAHITMQIDPKYLGGRISSHDTNNVRQDFERQSPKGIYERPEQLRQSVPFIKFSTLLAPHTTGPFKTITDNDDYIFLERSPLNKTDNVMFVFAGRKEKAYLPPLMTKQCRCVIVVTSTEYNDLKIPVSSPLLEPYDFLILNSRTKKDSAGNEVPVKIGKLIERRRAALLIAQKFRLENITFIDDNVLEVSFERPSNTQTLSLCDFMKAKMHASKEPIVSVSTFSNLHKGQTKNQPGCKIWMLDFKKFSDMLPTKFIYALMPENESACSEDYRLQVISHLLFADETEGVFGYQVLPSNEIQLKRTTGQKSTNSRAGMRLVEYTDEDALHPEMRQKLRVRSPELLAKFNKAHLIFNEKIRLARERYDAKLKRRQTLIRHPENALSAREKTAPGYEPNVDFTQNFVNILAEALGDSHAFSHQALGGKQVTLHPHQNEGLDWLINFLDNSERKEAIFNLATATGKTLLMLCIALAAYSADKEQNVMLVFPTIDLVQQTQNELFTKYSALLNYFQLTEDDSLGICSDPGDEAHKIINANQLLDETLTCKRKKIYLFCSASLTALTKVVNATEEALHRQENAQEVLNTASTYIFDESHALTTLRANSTLKNNSALFFDFSATPIKDSKDCQDNEYQYLREQAIKEGRLPPLYVDQSLPENLNNEDLAALLTNQSHPNGGALASHKGVIYMKSVTEAKALFDFLDHHSTLPKDFCSLIHSKRQNDPTEERSAVQKINEFKEKKVGLAIVVRMCVMGFDDPLVDYVIINKTLSSQNMHQANGRCIRNDESSPAKIGYALIRETNDKTEKTCFPDDKTSQKTDLEKNLRSVKETLFLAQSNNKHGLEEGYEEQKSAKKLHLEKNDTDSAQRSGSEDEKQTVSSQPGTKRYGLFSAGKSGENKKGKVSGYDTPKDSPAMGN